MEGFKDCYTFLLRDLVVKEPQFFPGTVQISWHGVWKIALTPRCQKISSDQQKIPFGLNFALQVPYGISSLKKELGDRLQNGRI